MNSTSTVFLSGKKILEFEELLTRLLERIDSIQPRSLWKEHEMDSILSLLDSQEASQLQTLASNVVGSKKKLIFAIEGSLSLLSNCQLQSSVLPFEII